MKLTSLRLGFATNSSSSHSILMLPGHDIGDRTYSTDGYGWEAFTLASVDEKLRYLAAQVAPKFGARSWYNDDEADDARAVNREAVATIQETLGVALDPLAIPYVDHQSQWTFPHEWDSDNVDREYLAYLRDFLSRGDLLVLGGNDNDGTHPLLEERAADGDWETVARDPSGRVLDLGEHWPLYQSVARRDGDMWAFFSRQSGAKARVWFGDGPKPTFAHAPELVDVKITDYCPFACPFCYQDSTLEGAHASTEEVIYVAEKLAHAQVFEVAIGGGEPTLHPRFVEILWAFRSRGVVPNFTTRNLAWLRNQSFVDQVAHASGTFAYSVQTADDVAQLAASLRFWPNDHYRRPNVHVVMGVTPRDEFRRILAACDENKLRPTLLGYKRVGRAQEPDHPYLDWWIDDVRASPMNVVGVDTALAAESQTALTAAGVPSWQFHVEDGRFSGYVDAVRGTMAPSSWEPGRGEWAYDENWQTGWIESASTP